MSTSNRGQYSYSIKEDGQQISGGPIDDPFVDATIALAIPWWRSVVAVFRPSWRHRVYTVSVGGSPAAIRVVMTGDYTATPFSPRAPSEATGTSN